MIFKARRTNRYENNILILEVHINGMVYFQMVDAEFSNWKDWLKAFRCLKRDAIKKENDFLWRFDND